MKAFVRATLPVLAFIALVRTGLPARQTTAQTREIKVGMIGLDTSHVTAFAKLLNDQSDPNHVPGARVVAAFKGGSPDVESSRTRIDKFTDELKDKWGVEIVDSIEELCKKVDAVLLESVDGRPHLNQARPVFAAKKRVFIDKPFAASYADAREIVRLSRESGTRVHSDGADVVVGKWKDGRVGTVRGIRDGKQDYGAVAFGAKANLATPTSMKSDYRDLLVEVVKFFQTGAPPVPPEETLEMMAFMEAADLSKARGGGPVMLKEVTEYKREK